MRLSIRQAKELFAEGVPHATDAVNRSKLNKRNKSLAPSYIDNKGGFFEIISLIILVQDSDLKM